jgi:hypothetical protein
MGKLQHNVQHNKVTFSKTETSRLMKSHERICLLLEPAACCCGQYHALNPFAGFSLLIIPHTIDIPFVSQIFSSRCINSRYLFQGLTNQQLPITNAMLPFNPHQSPCSLSRSHIHRGSLNTPFRHSGRFIDPRHPDMGIETSLLQREIPRCSFHPHHQSLFISRSAFSRWIDSPMFDSGHVERFLIPQSSPTIRIRVLIMSSCCNGILQTRDDFMATISISASVQDVYEGLAREVDRSSMGFNG